MNETNVWVFALFYSKDTVRHTAHCVDVLHATRASKSIRCPHEGAKPRVHFSALIDKGLFLTMEPAFSITEGSRFEPELSGVAVKPEGSVVVVDRGNRCVRMFTPAGGMPWKIHGSESLRDVAVLPDGHLVVTDRLVFLAVFWPRY